uniref:Uncharacterized protein n=1 Tax=Fervidicoccus fontis TaxID=683846 RepID=A0A7J3ZLP8_9CREN
MGSYIKVRVDEKKLREAIRSYLQDIYKYNRRIGGNYYLKPVHIVYKRGPEGEIKEYRYYGRYWYAVEYYGKSRGKSVIKWLYLGRNKPRGVPPPPKNPLEGLRYYTIRGEPRYLYVDSKTLERFSWFFEKVAPEGPL